jgi:cellobiose-specific phosphotransferase system component IIA
MNVVASSQSFRNAKEQEFDDKDFEIPEAQNRLKTMAQHIQVSVLNEK